MGCDVPRRISKRLLHTYGTWLPQTESGATEQRTLARLYAVRPMSILINPECRCGWAPQSGMPVFVVGGSYRSRREEAFQGFEVLLVSGVDIRQTVLDEIDDGAERDLVC